VDFAALNKDIDEFDFRGYGLSRGQYAKGSLRMAGCQAPPDGWKSNFFCRCSPSQVRERVPRTISALEIGGKKPACAIRDTRLTVFVVRPAVSNYWEAHFSLVETLLRLSALRLFKSLGRAGSNTSQVVFLPPDPKNYGQAGASLALWTALVGGPAVASRDVRPVATHCYSNAVFVAEMCCQAHDLCPASMALPGVNISAQGARMAPFRGSLLRNLPCARTVGIAGCGYNLFRSRMHDAMGFARPHAVNALGPPFVIMISRRTAQDRHMVDEEGVAFALPHLLPGGVKVDLVDFSAMPVLTQASRVARASVLAGIHGAGLTNMLFLPGGSAVAEVKIQEGWLDNDGGSKGSPDMYAEMSHRLGLGYAAWLYEDPLDGEGTVRISGSQFASLIARAMELR